MNLGRGQPGAVRILHRLEHVPDQGADGGGGGVLDLLRPPAQDRMAHAGDFQDCHGANMVRGTGPVKHRDAVPDRGAPALPNAGMLCYKPRASAGAASAPNRSSSASLEEYRPS